MLLKFKYLLIVISLFLIGLLAVHADARTSQVNIVEGKKETNLSWIAALYLNDNAQEKFMFTCTGALVSPKIVLTALHCVTKTGWNKYSLYPAESFQVGVGQNHLNKNRLSVSKIIIPENSIQPTYIDVKRDLALLVLNEPVNNKPIPVISSESQPAAKQIVRHFGYGVDEKNKITGYLKSAQALVQPTKSCKSLYAANETESYQINNKSFTEFICMSGATPRAGALCHGDSGGPGIIRPGVLVSIASLGDCGKFGVYSGINLASNNINDWLTDQIKQYQNDFSTFDSLRPKAAKICRVRDVQGWKLHKAIRFIKKSGCRVKLNKIAPNRDKFLPLNNSSSFDQLFMLNQCWNFIRPDKWNWRTNQTRVIWFGPKQKILYRYKTVLSLKYSFCGQSSENKSKI